MSNYGFGKRDKPENSSSTKPFDLSGLPRGPVTIDPVREDAAIRKGEEIGFTDRGQLELPKRRRRKKMVTANVFIKGPADLIAWLDEYTEQQGHSAYWRSLADFKKLVEEKRGDRGGE